MVEFAILLPVLLVILFGVLDLGRIMHAVITITNAAREGARYGSMYPSDGPGIVATVRQEAQSSGIDLTDTTRATIIQSCPSGCGRGLPLRIEVTYQFQLILGGFLPSQTYTVHSYADFMVP